MAKARRTRLWRWLAAVGGIVVLLYVGSYLYLSRRGMAEAERAGWPYFFYCPVADVVPYHDLPPQHCCAVMLFEPVNLLDRAWFRGGTPCRRVNWGLSGPTR